MFVLFRFLAIFYLDQTHLFIMLCTHFNGAPSLKKQFLGFLFLESTFCLHLWTKDGWVYVRAEGDSQGRPSP